MPPAAITARQLRQAPDRPTGASTGRPDAARPPQRDGLTGRLLTFPVLPFERSGDFIDRGSALTSGRGVPVYLDRYVLEVYVRRETLAALCDQSSEGVFGLLPPLVCGYKLVEDLVDILAR